MKLGRLGIAIVLAVPALWAQSIDGLWDGTLKQGTSDVPFKIGFSTKGQDAERDGSSTAKTNSIRAADTLKMAFSR